MSYPKQLLKKYSLVVQGYKNTIQRVIIDKLLLKDTGFWASSQRGFYDAEKGIPYIDWNRCNFMILI